MKYTVIVENLSSVTVEAMDEEEAMSKVEAAFRRAPPELDASGHRIRREVEANMSGWEVTDAWEGSDEA